MDLDVASPAAGPVGTNTLTPDAAVTRLLEAGLPCEQVPGEPLHILGGIARSRGEIRGYERAFAIFGEVDGGYTVAVAESRPHRDEETRVSTLAAAVEAVIGIYRRRSSFSAAV